MTYFKLLCELSKYLELNYTEVSMTDKKLDKDIAPKYQVLSWSFREKDEILIRLKFIDSNGKVPEDAAPQSRHVISQDFNLEVIHKKNKSDYTITKEILSREDFSDYLVHLITALSRDIKIQSVFSNSNI